MPRRQLRRPRWPPIRFGTHRACQKCASADLLQNMIQFVAQRMMEMDMGSLCDGAYEEGILDRIMSPRQILNRIAAQLAGIISMRKSARAGMRALAVQIPNRCSRIAMPSALARCWSNLATTSLVANSENRALCGVLSSSRQRPFLCEKTLVASVF